MLKELVKLIPRNTQNMRSRYGISEKVFLDTLYSQSGLCAICGVRFTETVLPCIDHCHTHGHMRGILCSKCNTGIGLLGENTHILEQAVSYINKDKLNAEQEKIVLNTSSTSD